MGKTTGAKSSIHQDNPNLFNRKLEKPFNLYVSVLLILLIFLSILPYASSDVWSEAIICITIFILNIFAIIQGKYSALEIEYTKLFTPLLILAVYSFIQGVVTLLIQNQIPPFSAILPYSFDLTASFWNAAKILAVVSFIRLLLIVFRSNIKLLVWSLIVTGNFFALLGIFRYLIQNNFPNIFQYFIFPQLTQNTGFGTFINQNHFAFLMLMTIGLNICLLWRGNLKIYQRYILLLFSLITWISLILTGSRGGIISSFAEIAVLIFFPIKKLVQNMSNPSPKINSSRILKLGGKLIIFAGISFILVLGVIFIGQNRVVNRFEKLPLQFEEINDVKGFQRIDVFQATTMIIREHPFYGIGFGSFRFAVSKYINISGQIAPEQAHNDYLEYIASSGIIGLILAMWFLIRFFNLVKKRFSESSNHFSDVVRLGAICGIIGAALHSLFDFGLQMTANLIFFAVLLTIAVHKDYSNSKDDDREISPQLKSKRLTGFNYFHIVLFIDLIIVSAIFGYSRFALSHPEIASEFGVNENNLINFPFDAEFYKEESFADIKLNNNAEAINNLTKAINYRPNDYALWLKLGQLQQAENQNEAAANSFRRSIELAPRYGEPHYYYGNFLVRSNNKVEGFDELRYAFQRNAVYFYDVAALAWRETGENGLETINLLSPLNLPETAMLNMFFLEKESYDSIVSLNCQNENTSQSLSDTLVKNLLEKRDYYFAHLIYKSICKDSDAKFIGLENGDFEKEDLNKGIGFDWRINSSLPKEITINFDKTTASNGNSSLEFVFNGNIKPNLPLLSQILFVEKNRKYNLTFSYKTRELVTGGIPVLQIILKQKDSDIKINETKLLPENKNWTQSSIEILTNEKTEAIEVRLSRQSCNQNLCPIFGNLWLDDFDIKEKN